MQWLEQAEVIVAHESIGFASISYEAHNRGYFNAADPDDDAASVRIMGDSSVWEYSYTIADILKAELQTDGSVLIPGHDCDYIQVYSMQPVQATPSKLGS